jgi:hypothetical protein
VAVFLDIDTGNPLTDPKTFFMNYNDRDGSHYAADDNWDKEKKPNERRSIEAENAADERVDDLGTVTHSHPMRRDDDWGISEQPASGFDEPHEQENSLPPLKREEKGND